MLATRRNDSSGKVIKKDSLPEVFLGRSEVRCVPTMRRHLFVCTNERSSGKPACGGGAIVRAVQTLLVGRSNDRGDAGDVTALVTPCGCLGPCFDGPNAVVYPDGIWYGALGVDDAPGLVDHLTRGIVLDAKVREPPGQ